MDHPVLTLSMSGEDHKKIMTAHQMPGDANMAQKTLNAGGANMAQRILNARWSQNSASLGKH